jgi:sulfatase modifying factor 1
MSRILSMALTIGLMISLAACSTATRAGTFKPDEMVLVPAGDFMMGSPRGEGAPDQHPQHKVFLPAFYMDKYEVTVGQYKGFVEETGYRPLFDWVSRVSPGDNYPVVGVSWFDARAYAEWAKKRLPTEAEWEYACRAGTTTKYNTGDTMEPGEANFAGVVGNDRWERAAPVGSFAPNAWGLYDMHGNVFEWCYDRYDKKYYKYSLYINPIGPTDIKFEYRVMRGGSWVSDPRFRGSASRLSGLPERWGNNEGFRCVRDAQ